MLPVQGIGQAQQVDPRYLPGNTYYVFSVEHVTFDGSQRRDVVYGGTSVPRFVFVPIVDFPQMGKNFAPLANYGLAQFESTLANQLSNASRPDGGLPMVRKLAIHCVQELIENYRAWGLTDLAPLTGLSRDDIARVYTAVLPPYLTKPGLEAVKRAMLPGEDGKSRFLIDHVRLLDDAGREFEPDFRQLVEDVTNKNYYPGLPAHLTEVAVSVQEAIRMTIERAIEYRQHIVSLETSEIAASKTNGGKGLTSYTNRAKRYAHSLGLELIDPVYVQRKEAVMATESAATSPMVIPGLAEALTNLAAAVETLRPAPPVDAASEGIVEPDTPSNSAKKPKPGNKPKES